MLPHIPTLSADALAVSSCLQFLWAQKTHLQVG